MTQNIFTNAGFIFPLQFAEVKGKFWNFGASSSPDAQDWAYNISKGATTLSVLLGREGCLSVRMI